MPKTATVTLDGTEYTITELRPKANAAWRARLREPFSELAALLESGPDTEITDLASLANVVRSVSGLLFESIDTLTALLAEYAPDLPLDDAYESEQLEAFTEVLSLAFPFGALAARIRGLLRESTRQS